ncbi:MAG: hypothetical protein HY965_06100 [Ignavibacteriales bacterium]|nr:hypothetical protein [Ignavibacteriales bacterium]
MKKVFVVTAILPLLFFSCGYTTINVAKFTPAPARSLKSPFNLDSLNHFHFRYYYGDTQLNSKTGHLVAYNTLDAKWVDVATKVRLADLNNVLGSLRDLGIDTLNYQSKTPPRFYDHVLYVTVYGVTKKLRWNIRKPETEVEYQLVDLEELLLEITDILAKAYTTQIPVYIPEPEYEPEYESCRVPKWKTRQAPDAVPYDGDGEL